ncbi:YidC/Oxa1 family membrane protein insertase [Streptomyces sp. NPDC006879]|uniref:YidC/Oxa1 family membrane protein insertase n=1 Tax=Streptomyces sp. NPDC006879 TaxID=3364767 RepID=UPI0036CED6D8
MSFFAVLVLYLSQLLQPVFAASAGAAAVVLFTALVRAAMHPLSRAAFRGERARQALAPRVAKLRRRYARPKDADRLRAALLELQAEAKVSPLAGVLPVLAQLPVFFVMYRLFASGQLSGEPNVLLGQRLSAAPLGSRWVDALREGGPWGSQGLVFLCLFAAIALVATWSVVRARRTAGASGPASTGAVVAEGGSAAVKSGGAGDAARRVGRLLPLLAFGTLVTAAIVPLAAGLYLLTTTAWTVAERAWLQWLWGRRQALAEGGMRSSP